MRSPFSLFRNSSRLPVRLLTLEGKGDHCWARVPSAWEGGKGSITERESQGKKTPMPLRPPLLADHPLGSRCNPKIFKVPGWRGGGPPGQDPVYLVDHSLLRPHVRLRAADFVHELAKSYSVVAGELP